MATQICPKCKQDSFTWSVDDEKPRIIRWGCTHCQYSAYEDESNERICEKCSIKIESLLDDGEDRYWWCCKCNSITIIQKNERI